MPDEAWSRCGSKRRESDYNSQSGNIGDRMKIIASALTILAIYLLYTLWLGDHGVLRLWNMQDTQELQSQENVALQERNRTLHAEVVDLKKGTEAVEERARSELGMIKKGEKFYQVIEPNDGGSRAP